MKKFIIFVVTMAMVSVATASPTWNTVSVKSLTSKASSDYAKHAKFLQSSKIANKKMKVKAIDDQTLIVSVDSHKIRVERVGENSLEFNGIPVKFSPDESPQELIQKIAKALNTDNKKVSFLESLFIPEAQAVLMFTWPVWAGLLAIGLAVFGGYKWGQSASEKKYKTASAAVPAAVYQTPAAQTSPQYTAPANPKAGGTPYIPAVPGSVSN